MRPLSTAELLDAWEQGFTAPAHKRSLPLLAAASPELSFEELGALSLGQRDARLFTLREWVFGPQLLSATNCLACAERVEWTLNTADIPIDVSTKPDNQLGVVVGPYAVRFRLPNMTDLIALTEFQDPIAAQAALLTRCVTGASFNEREIAVTEFNAEVTGAIARCMAEADPQADLQLAMTCPSCGHGWQALLDIESFFWSELTVWAKRILGEVHTLACAYGWNEGEILDLSGWRRNYYLGLVSG